MLEKTFESPLDCMGIKPVNPKGNQPWTFIGRTEAEAPILWLADARNWFIGKDPGKDWRQEDKGMTEDNTVGQHHQLNGHEFEQALVMEGEDWRAEAHGVTKSRTRLIAWTELKKETSWGREYGKVKSGIQRNEMPFLGNVALLPKPQMVQDG